MKVKTVRQKVTKRPSRRERKINLRDDFIYYDRTSQLLVYPDREKGKRILVVESKRKEGAKRTKDKGSRGNPRQGVSSYFLQLPNDCVALQPVVVLDKLEEQLPSLEKSGILVSDGRPSKEDIQKARETQCVVVDEDVDVHDDDDEDDIYLQMGCDFLDVVSLRRKLKALEATQSALRMQLEASLDAIRERHQVICRLQRKLRGYEANRLHVILDDVICHASHHVDNNLHNDDDDDNIADVIVKLMTVYDREKNGKHARE